MNNTILYLDKEKSEGLARNFKQMHLNAYNICCPLKRDIEYKPEQSLFQETSYSILLGQSKT